MTKQPRGRVDWDAIKGRIPIEAVAASLLGPAEGRGGSKGLWWSCPFHEDRNPSFQVQPDRGERGRWICRAGCGSGDAIALVMRLEGATFPQAVNRLAGMIGLDAGDPSPAPSPRPKPPASPEKRPAKPIGVSAAKALAIQLEGESLLARAVERLWGDEGREQLDYLRGRGVLDAEIGSARLGLIDWTRVPRKSGEERFATAGIVIPWFGADGRLEMLKVRRLGVDPDPRYHATYWGRPSLYPSPAVVRFGRPVVVVEGELDAILLARLLGDAAPVVTLGSAGGKPSREALRALKRASIIYVATDADPAGDDAAERLTKHFPDAIRIRPPAPAKDWTEAHAGGFGRIAYHWGRHLPLGDPPRPEEFADASLYEQAPDERDHIEAIEEREAIQAEPPSSTMSTPLVERRGDDWHP